MLSDDTLTAEGDLGYAAADCDRSRVRQQIAVEVHAGVGGNIGCAAAIGF